MASAAEVHGANGFNGHHHHHQKQQRTHLSEVGTHMVAASGEFVGTFFFLYFGYAGNVIAVLQEPAAAPNGTLANNTIIWIAMAYGFSLLVNFWAFYRISGGLFNPAVSYYTRGQARCADGRARRSPLVSVSLANCHG
jgi:aquaporin rerated protein, other eukaryote